MSNECRLRLEWVPEAYKANDSTSPKPVFAAQKPIKPLTREAQSLKISKRKYKR